MNTRIGQCIKKYESVGSTNTKAKEWIKEGAKHGSIVLAQKQTFGKGRLGRNWESPYGTGIWMSVILKPDINIEKMSTITLVAGLGVCETIKQHTGLDAKIKWPNDIVINGKKVCGILSESMMDQEGKLAIIVGIGINVNMSSFGELLPYATSLAIEGKTTYDKEQIVKLFAKRFEELYTIYENGKGFSELLEPYRNVCLNVGKRAKIIRNGEVREVTIKDIVEDGSLLVINEFDKEESVLAGEVSVRGLYGYV